LAQKAGPFSLWKVQGSPNLGIILLIRTLITSQAFSEKTGEGFYPSSKCIYQDREEFRSWSSWQMGEVKLPVFPRICASSLGPRDRQDRVAGIVALANFTSSDSILEGIFKSNPLKELTIQQESLMYP
jgi:hypothetical protein